MNSTNTFSASALPYLQQHLPMKQGIVGTSPTCMIAVTVGIVHEHDLSVPTQPHGCATQKANTKTSIGVGMGYFDESPMTDEEIAEECQRLANEPQEDDPEDEYGADCDGDWFDWDEHGHQR